ncbi:MAG TPA: FHA domain-containing protein, partial [Pseudobdellovibrionaceae bacterium]|nr:FHA domain-containing protein [Pseudobdellovibrionaceae bacterium]
MKSPVILRVFKNSQLVEVKQFDSDQIVIGHDADVQLDLPGEGVSAIHCLIERRDSGHYICDLGSEGGTFKNGQAVLDEPLNSGDEVQIGVFKIVFYVGVPKPKAAPTETETAEKPVPVPMAVPAPPMAAAIPERPQIPEEPKVAAASPAPVPASPKISMAPV